MLVAPQGVVGLARDLRKPAKLARSLESSKRAWSVGRNHAGPQSYPGFPAWPAV